MGGNTLAVSFSDASIATRGGAKGARGAMASPFAAWPPSPFGFHGKWGLNSYITIIATVFEELSPNRHI